ncbi:hypothetical protein QFZ58_004018 [Streptomyces sp. B1I3]|nr:hypothetical protein [Streptomyces sp. B1I3]
MCKLHWALCRLPTSVPLPLGSLCPSSTGELRANGSTRSFEVMRRNGSRFINGFPVTGTKRLGAAERPGTVHRPGAKCRLGPSGVGA